MSAYLKIDAIPGNVSTSGYEGYIECLSADLSTKRNVNATSGLVSSRSAGMASMGELHLTKFSDKSSPKLFEYVCNGKAIPQATLVYCQTGSKIEAYSKQVLYNVIVTRYSENYDELTQQPTEAISLNFSKLEKKYYPRDSKNKLMSPISAGFDRETGTVI